MPLIRSYWPLNVRLRESADRRYAVELTLDLVWTTGAPMPFLISNGYQAAVDEVVC